PPREEHVVFGLELLELGLEPREIAIDGGRHRSSIAGSGTTRAAATARARMGPDDRRSALRSRPRDRQSGRDRGAAPRRWTRSARGSGAPDRRRSRGIPPRRARSRAPRETPECRAAETPARSRTDAAVRRTALRAGPDPGRRAPRRSAARAARRTARTAPAVGISADPMSWRVDIVLQNSLTR